MDTDWILICLLLVISYQLGWLLRDIGKCGRVLDSIAKNTFDPEKAKRDRVSY